RLPRRLTRGGEFVESEAVAIESEPLGRFIQDPRLGGVLQHSSRSHMKSDLERYFFAATFAAVEGRSPKLSEFPTSLLPDHKNALAMSQPFSDRFRVQVGSRPSSTVVS